MLHKIESDRVDLYMGGRRCLENGKKNPRPRPGVLVEGGKAAGVVGL